MSQVVSGQATNMEKEVIVFSACPGKQLTWKKRS